MQSRLGLAHFSVFILCGLISVSACCLGLFGVLTHQTYVNQANLNLKAEAVQEARLQILHPKEKKWEPVFVLSQYSDIK